MLRRILLPVLFSILLLSAAVLTWFPYQLEVLLRESLVRRGQLAAETLDKSAIGALVVYDAAALGHLAKGLIRANEFLYVVILDKDGQILADSGVAEVNQAFVRSQLPAMARSDSNRVSEETSWPETAETLLHISRPVYYEQVRIGTVGLGLSTRRVKLAVRHLQLQLALLCGAALLLGLAAAWASSRALSRRVRSVATGIESGSEPSLESAAGRIPELNLLVEQVIKTRNLFQHSLDDMENQKVQLEAQAAALQDENLGLSSRVASLSKQLETVQQEFRELEERSKRLTSILPLVQFAAGIVPEIDLSMQHVSNSAGRLREDMERLKNLIDLYEKTPPRRAQDLEVIHHYKKFINYDQIKQSLDELITTISGGATWAEQLADLLKQLAQFNEAKAK
ncbi:MAG: hypothetical protein AB1898_09620 [Acidobacteriota bacterium]